MSAPAPALVGVGMACVIDDLRSLSLRIEDLSNDPKLLHHPALRRALYDAQVHVLEATREMRGANTQWRERGSEAGC